MATTCGPERCDPNWWPFTGGRLMVQNADTHHCGCGSSGIGPPGEAWPSGRGGGVRGDRAPPSAGGAGPPARGRGGGGGPGGGGGGGQGPDPPRRCRPPNL